MNLVKENINILLPLSVITGISWKLIPEFQFLYYLTPILLLLFIVAGLKEILQNKFLRTISIMFFAFGIWAMLTALWSDYPLFSFVRAGYFIILSLGAISGILLWSDSKAFRNNPFGFLLPANLFILITSLISLFLEWPKGAWTGGNGVGFMGIFGVQLTLGGAVLFTLPSLVFLLLKHISKTELHKKSLVNISFLLFIIILNLLVIVLSHSRAALFSASVGVLLTFFLVFNRKKKIYLVGALLFVIVIIGNNSFLLSKTEKYVLKGTSHLTANREILWNPSVEAAKKGGVFGIGYGTSVKEIETEFKNVESDGKIRREKGNGILALIEEVGLLGFLLFSLPIFYVLKIFQFNNNNMHRSESESLYQTSSVLISFLIAFLFHAQSESWMVGMGCFSLLIFLMVLALFNVLSSKSV